MLCGWRGARFTASQMRAHFTMCLKRRSLRPGGPTRRNSKLSVTPTGTADEMPSGLRRAAYRAQYARALHHIREAAGGLRRRGATRAELKGKRGPSGANAARLARRHRAHCEPEAGEFHRGPRMRCGWGCGAQLTGHQMRAHFTICAKRLAASDHMDRRGRNSSSSGSERAPSSERLCLRHLSPSIPDAGPFRRTAWWS
jgi:hypothetical protein